MKKSIAISIPSPCAEQWENFIPTNEGGFCESCQKNVVDFRQMSDQQLLDYLAEAKGKTCGRFRPDQIKTYTTTYPSPKYFGLNALRNSLAALSIVLLSKSAAISFPIKQPTLIYLQESPNLESYDQYTTGDKHYVSGTVLDNSTKEGLPSVSILLKGTKISVQTDLDGFFTFPQPLKEGDVLVFSYIGMERKEYKITDGDKNIEVYLIPDLIQLGAVVIEGNFSEKPLKPSVWQRVASWF